MLSHEQILRIREQYGDDERAILESSSSLDVLYAFGSLRENLLDWYDFIPGTTALLISECPAVERMLKRKNVTVFIYEPDIIGKFETGSGTADGSDCAAESSGKQDTILGNEKNFDYVISIGDIDKLTGTEIAAVYDRLKKGGTLMAACDNRYGIKYLNGVKPPECTLTKDELFARLGGRQEEDLLYYPMPDYRLPTSIYSESYLPQEGELSRAVAAYDDAEFTAADLGKRYDEICRDGRFEDFANSFLVIRQKS